MATNNPWIDPPSPESLILRREPVDRLNEENLRELIETSQQCIRTQNVEGLLGFIGLEIEVNAFELVNGKKVPAVQNRDRFLIGLLGLLESGNNKNYTMNINSIEIKDGNNAAIDLTVTNPDVLGFGSVSEIVEVALYKGRAVITKLIANA